MRRRARQARALTLTLLPALLGMTMLAPICGQAAPLSFEMPFAGRQTHSDTRIDSFALPTAPFAKGKVPSLALEGNVTRLSWQVSGQMTTLQLLAPLREQLEGMGFTPVLQCDTDACGGFDFRFGVDVIQAPDMNVDLFDFRALTAQRGTGEDADYVFLLVSRAGSVGYVQLVHITPEQVDLTVPEADDAPGSEAVLGVTTPSAEASDIADTLTASGRVVLGDLIFATGSSELAEAPYPSLSALADFLKVSAGRRVVLVGHTDTEGRLESNIALSKRRARAVMERLTRRYNVPASQMSAEGAGYLAPMASNETEAGRETNRRVEAVLLSLS
tara:strand:- start:53 stop:1045 length:993 start_codon:yes stop_codon:yes gene_type:complete